jgi:hypothetical protein
MIHVRSRSFCLSCLLCSLFTASQIAFFAHGVTVLPAKNALAFCEPAGWTTEEYTQFHAWTNKVLSGLKMEIREECAIYSDVVCSNKVATERLYVFCDTNRPAFIKKINDDVKSLKDEQFDFFAWKTLGDYIKYYRPPVVAALWVRVLQGREEEVLRMHVFRPGDYLFQHFGRDHMDAGAQGERSYIEKIPSSLFSALPWTEDMVLLRSNAISIAALVPDYAWSKGEIPKVAHFHRPGFHQGYLFSEVSFPCQRRCEVKLGYVDQQLFDVCFTFPPVHSVSASEEAPTKRSLPMVDLNALLFKQTGLPDLSRFVAFAKEMSCPLIYALKYTRGSQGKVSEYFFSSPDKALQFSFIESKNREGISVWSFSYYIDVTCLSSVRTPSFSRKNGRLVEGMGKVVQEEAHNLIYRMGDKEPSSIRLICLQEDASKDLFLARPRQPEEIGEYWCFQNKKLKSIKNCLSDHVFSGDSFFSPFPLGLGLPVIGRTRSLSLRPDCL